MSVKKNFIYNSLITVSSYVCPLITYPYVSRILGVGNIGICNFVDSLVNYFVLFSMMGITTVGIRAITENKNDKIKLSRDFWSILCLNAITTVMAIVALIVAIYTVPDLFPYRNLLYVGVCKLAFNLFLVEWFYVGLEDFAYITQRTLLVRLLYIISIFLFIRKAEDYPWYYILTVASVCINAVINILHSRMYVHLSFKDVSVRPFLYTFVVMGIYILITNVYTSLNVVWLGVVTDTIQVGYYTTATKLYTIIMAFFSAFSSVLFPRVSSLLSENLQDEYWYKIRQAVDVLFAISMPMIITAFTCSAPLVVLLSGKGYEGAYLPFKIITPLLFIVGLEQIVVLQILLAHKKETLLLIVSIVGALTSVVVNLICTKPLGATGSAIAWLISELMTLTLSLIFAHIKFNYHFPVKEALKYVFAYIPLIITLTVGGIVFDYNSIITLALIPCIVVAYTLILQKKYLKNEVISQTIGKLTSLTRSMR